MAWKRPQSDYGNRLGGRRRSNGSESDGDKNKEGGEGLDTVMELEGGIRGLASTSHMQKEEEGGDDDGGDKLNERDGLDSGSGGGDGGQSDSTSQDNEHKTGDQVHKKK